MRDLLNATLNIDLLMVRAATGAANINARREAGIFLELFSALSTLRGFTLGKTIQAVEDSSELSPK